MSNRSAWRTAAVTWVEARIYVAVAFAVSSIWVDRFGSKPSTAPVSQGLLAWDGEWYRQIADQGYAGGDDPAVRFFPLFPLVGRIVGWLVGTELGLVVVANSAALVAAVGLYQLTLQETGDHRTAKNAARLLAIFPSAFVLVLAYSEGLFLALAIGTVVALRARRWWTAALLAYLAGLTRPVAGFLALPALLHGFQARRRLSNNPRDVIGAGLSIVAAPAGTLTFLIWCRNALGNGWAPIEQQELLRGSSTEPIGRLWTAFTEGVAGDEGELFHFFAAIAILVLLVVAIRNLSADLLLYAVPSVVFLIAAENLNSMERYALSTFPLVIAAALMSRQGRLGKWILPIAALGMVAVCTLSLNGAYVP